MPDKITVYLLRMRNANTYLTTNILWKNKDELQKFKEDADKDGRYITSEIEEKEAESVKNDNTVYAINVYDNAGMREIFDVRQKSMIYEDFIKKELGLTK